ncbi:GH3 family domain-containing protein [Segetibacter aerophilus]|uniref:GH3 auxin-responsive promoter n=1 Tax=Segetibacter aerophilus TaxID=670293 RepID=A0A512BJK4_9BACT|nr:GH3 auxin-responsive promoter family protein [Segetibacter aerophilus]GEO12055.1 hypothetical protein SAE01_45510 [Segetibacter aerophilus]
MKVSKTYLLNKLMLSFGKVSHHNYYSSQHKVDVVQKQKLFAYLANNCTTLFGREHEFAKIKDYASYATAVPIIEDWKQVERYIKRIEKGEQNVLCTEAVDAFEETSGSTGFSKLIPYNKGLKKEFEKALQVWMIDLHGKLPQSFRGKSYWSLSPALKETRFTEGGIRVGLENDAAYFSPIFRYFLSRIIAVNSNTAKIKEPYDFYFATLKQLLLQEDLSFISVWSPTFFLQLDEFMKANFTFLLEEVRKVDRRRHRQLKEITQEVFTWKDIWPNLACISCWTDAQASIWLSQVERIAGEVWVQPKGLLSTEAVVSIPIKGAAYPALAYQSHFFEFRQTDNSTIHLAHQLLQDECYEVIVTTAGGLYRYVTKDVVQVAGFQQQIPLLKFLGRHSRTSDLVGEKVSEIQVNKIIDAVLKGRNMQVAMIFLKPEKLNQSGRYTLYIELSDQKNQQELLEMVKQFEQILCQNPYYQQALNTGQLKPMQYQMLPKGFKENLAIYYREKKLIKDGNIKLPALFLEHELKDIDFYREQLHH